MALNIDQTTIGITGGIGSGKSVVSRILRCNGFVVFDCDYEAKKIMIQNPEVKKKLTSAFGIDVYLPSGEIDRQRMAQLIFNNSSKREIVNSIVHEAVKKEILNLRKITRSEFFIESAILASSGIESYCNKIWIVTTSEKERIQRVIKRDGLTEKEVLKRIESQKKELTFLPKCKITYFENDDEHPMLIKVLQQTDKFYLQTSYLLSC